MRYAALICIYFIACQTTPQGSAAGLQDRDVLTGTIPSVTKEDLAAIARTTLELEFKRDERVAGRVEVVDPGIVGEWIPAIDGLLIEVITPTQAIERTSQHQTYYFFREFRLTRGGLEFYFLHGNLDGCFGYLYQFR